MGIKSHNHAAHLLEFLEEEFSQVVSLVGTLLVWLGMGRCMVRSVMRSMVRLLRWHICRATGQIDVNATSVIFGAVLQPKFPTDLLNPGLEFLDVVRGVVSFSDDPTSSQT